VQVHGGMGFIEETGAAQYYRDAKILTIYEGTTAIQANDLVGRKTARDGGPVARPLRADRGPPRPSWRSAPARPARPWPSACTAAREAFWIGVVDFVAGHTKASPNAVFAGSVPYLMLAGNLMAGWQMARALMVAEDQLAAGVDADFMQAKIATARFYADHILRKAPAARQHRRTAPSCRHRPAAGGLLMALPGDTRALAARLLPLPIIGSPLFIISNPKLVIAQCIAGVVGSHALAQCAPGSQLDEWLAEITEGLAAWDRAHPDQPAAPFAINQIVHKSNDRLEHDMAGLRQVQGAHRHHQPGRARVDINDAVHAWGGVVLHDIINNAFAHKAIDKGADGLIAVAAGAGGHAGVKSPFALIQEIREWFDGPLALSGAMPAATGAGRAGHGGRLCLHRLGLHRHRRGARHRGLQAAIVDSSSDDIVYSNLFTGVHGNYLKPSIRAPAWTPRAPARERPEQDELRRRRRQEGLEGHLGLRPGHRRGRAAARACASELVLQLRRPGPGGRHRRRRGRGARAVREQVRNGANQIKIMAGGGVSQPHRPARRHAVLTGRTARCGRRGRGRQSVCDGACLFTARHHPCGAGGRAQHRAWQPAGRGHAPG
jgi:nitronate monooxygenase